MRNSVLINLYKELDYGTGVVLHHYFFLGHLKNSNVLKFLVNFTVEN